MTASSMRATGMYKIKKWRREWKMKLIEEMNPEWRDFYEDLNK